MSAAPTHACSRLAPSPTGPLHLGNACTFLVNWALARNQGWALRLRIEDLDSARVAAATADVQADLSWLGLDHDGEVWLQSNRVPHYQHAMQQLSAQGLVYESPHSRSEVRDARERDARETDDGRAALSAPHGPARAAFPRSLRPGPGAAWQFQRMDVNHRLRVDDEAIRIADQLQGEHTFAPAHTDGDFIVWTKSSYPAYQLAVVVDDIAQGVTDVVRGADLLPSSALQALIYRALGAPAPRWWHLPLVVDHAGGRLAKRRGSESLSALRTAGVDPARVVGLTAWWTGAQASLKPMSASQFCSTVTPSMLRAWCNAAQRQAPTLTPAVLEWLHAC